ncbi:MAG: ComF family protein [Fimbriimonadaceae bacterium]|nr:ComF family protein [Fimbriimonadaceae bacterium]QYK56939.1 MAG: ComF family protein [Fimbriimonadaceae bacterium]
MFQGALRDRPLSPPEWLEAALDWVYPRRCCLCESLGVEPICERCRLEFPVWQDRLGAPHGPLDWSYGLYPYWGRASQAVRRLKYQRETALARPLAAELAAARAALPYHDMVVPVPIHQSRHRERGFNQAELLTEGMPDKLVSWDCLVRIRKTRPQVELSAAERLSSLRDAFRADPQALNRHVLLVDDVLTTGGTAVACASALKIAGAASVGVLTYCVGN